MLAGILLNLPVGRKYPASGRIDGKYIMVQGTYIDPEDRPEPEVVKKVVRAVRKIKLPRQEAIRAERLIVQASAPQKKTKTDLAGLDIIAYRSLVEMLKRNIYETEEEELLLLLLEL